MTGSFATYIGVKGGRFIIGFFIVITLHFLIPRMMPGSPVFAMLGPEVVGLSQKEFIELESQLGLHDPFYLQFSRHIRRVATFDFGFSYYFHQPVKQVLWEHMKPTLLLLLPSVLASSVLACLLGAISGRLAGRFPDVAVTLFFLFLYSTPVFLLAMAGLDLFSFRLDLFPLGGLKSMDATNSFFAASADAARHLILPVAVLTLSSTAAKYLVMRNSVSDKLHEDYVVFARARGFGEVYILFVHILRHACLPLVSLVGLHFAFILSGSLLVEIVFSINGMGSLMHDAAINRDYPVLHAAFLCLTLVVLVVNMITDLLLGVLDPRVRV